MPDTITLTFSEGEGSEPRCVEIPRQLGHVSLVREVGRGGMGVVWQGHDELLRRDVAVKLFRNQALASDPGLRHQFIEGTRAAAVVKHPHVVSVYHADEFANMFYVVMEFVEGCNLREVLTRWERLQAGLAALVMARVLEATAAIHASDVVHRDLKPSNVMFDEQGELLVSDFGLSYHRAHVPAGPESALGTPPYMAPEMFEGDASFQSDVYAAGITYYELLTGRRPFRADIVADYYAQHLGEPLPEGPLRRIDLPDQVCDVVIRATNKKKIFRYKSAVHMLKAIGEAYPDVLRDQTLDRQLKELVREASGAAERHPSARAAEAPAEATYFDLLSRRADAKRQRKRQDST